MTYRPLDLSSALAAVGSAEPPHAKAAKAAKPSKLGSTANAGTTGPQHNVALLDRRPAVASFSGISGFSARGNADHDDTWVERAAIAEFDGGLSREDAEAVAEACLPPGGHVPLDEGGIPAGPCLRCGCRSFWRLSMTLDARWNCNVCDRRPVAVFTDACTLPGPAGIGFDSF
jgi:hypothetical protein